MYLNLFKYQVLTTVELRQFLVAQQGEEHSSADIDELLERHEPDPSLRAMGEFRSLKNFTITFGTISLSIFYP